MKTYKHSKITCSAGNSNTELCLNKHEVTQETFWFDKTSECCLLILCSVGMLLVWVGFQILQSKNLYPVVIGSR